MWDMNDRERMFFCYFRIKIISKDINMIYVGVYIYRLLI